MYAFIAGTLEEVGPPAVVLAGGIGYEIWVPQRHWSRLPPRGEALRLHTHLQLREDAMTLYGFPSSAEREIFRTLITVSGVGPKVALAILGDGDAERVLAGIRAGEPGPLLKIKGVGRKTAERVVLELRDRAAAWLPARSAAAGGRESAEGPELQDEAELALVAMGLAPERARQVLGEVAGSVSPEAGVEDLVRLALRKVVPR